MPRRIFPAGSVANTTGAPLRLTFHYTQAGNTRATDLVTVDGSNYVDQGIVNGLVVTDVTGAYSAFAGPDDVDFLWVQPHTGAARTQITATGTVANGLTVDNATYASGGAIRQSQRRPAISFASPGSTFQTGHGWTSSGSGATYNLNDTSDYVMGSQCISAVTDGSQGNHWFQKFLGTAVDLTNHDLVLWVKVSSVAALRKIVLYAASDNLTNYYSGSLWDFSFGTVPGCQLRDNEWFPLRFNLSDITSATGSPVKTAITGFRISPQDISGSGGVTIKFGGLGIYPRPTATYPNGVVTFGFDDSFISTRTLAAPYLAKYGWAGTEYLICDALAGAGITPGSEYGMTIAQARELRDIYGWELAAHAYTVTNHGISYADLDAATLTTEVQRMTVWLQNNGLLTSNHFAYPRGRHNATAEQILSRYYSTARTLASLPLEVQQPGSPMRSRALQITTGLTATATAAIDKAYLNGNWLQLVFHDIVSSGATGNQVNLSEFQTIVDYCNTKGIAVAPASDVWRANL